MMALAQARRVVALSILAGLIAAGVLAALNQIIVRPYVALITDAVVDEMIADREYDEEEFDSKVSSIQVSQTAGAAAIGVAAGALIGGVRAFGKATNVRIAESVAIAAIAWFVLYVVPIVKYPPSPIALFDDEAAGQYYSLYFGYTAVSGLVALGIVGGSMKVTVKNKLLGLAALYLVAIAVAFFVFPGYELDLSFDQQLLTTWRASISAAMTAFWFAAGLIAGLLLKYGAKTDRATK